jgi:DNA end-binding protein Ku
MKAIWSGAISFGLILIPVRLYSAVKERQLRFNLLRKKDLCPISYLRVCRRDGDEVPYQDIVKGYEYKKGDYVILHDDDFKKANIKKTQTIEVTDFVDEKQVDIDLIEKPYYLEPAKEAKKAYALLAEALKRTRKAGVARFVLRSRERLALIRPHGNLLVLNQLRFINELRPAKGLNIPETKDLRGKELEIAIKLIDQLTEPFNPQKYHDTYSEELQRVILEKAKGKAVKARSEESEPTLAPDLMVKLRQSLQEAQKRKIGVKK